MDPTGGPDAQDPSRLKADAARSDVSITAHRHTRQTSLDKGGPMSNLTAATRGLPNPRRGTGGAGRDEGRDPDDVAEADVVHRNERTVVRREPRPGGDDGASEIHKRALGPAAVERTRHERSVLDRLSGVTGVPHLLPGGSDDTLVVEDMGGRPLATVISSEEATGDLGWICTLGLKLALVVGAVHDAGVVHRDLNPGNIFIVPSPTGELEPVLVDFDLSTTFAQVKPSFVDPREIVGRLPYLAPEQTGRTSVPVDQRSDLYSLGVVLYELATGAPPFVDDDPLKLVRQILTRRPEPPDQLAPRVPVMFSRIVVRLLQKEPDDRYSSAAGLAYDLAQVVDDPQVEFPLGQRDFPRRLAPPSRIVGRAAETDRLTVALNRAVLGQVQGVLVSGRPGVGKTDLVNQLRSLVVARGGWFVWGRADANHHRTTTSLFTDAANRLGGLLLAEPETELVRLRERLLDSLGVNAGLIATLVPTFRQLLGTEVEEGTAQDASAASARLAQAAPDLLREIASPDRPLVMLLDDLQWAPPSTSAAIDALLGGSGLRGLLVVGCYRDDQIDDDHPLAVMIDRWEQLEVGPDRLHLDNLPASDIATLVAEMLRIPHGAAADLADVLVKRTDGNPADTVELINGLRHDGALVLGERGWTWDERAVRGYVGTGDAADALTARIAKLPEDCVAVLRTMARLGADRPVPTLAAACALEPAELVSRLAPALDDGLVVAGDGMVAADGGIREGSVAESDYSVHFRHRRVRDVLRETAPDDRAAGLTLARRLVGTTDLDAAAQQYLGAVDLVDSPDEQRRVVELFRTVAAQACKLGDFAVVDEYLTAAIGLHLRTGGGPDDGTGRALVVEHHAALVALGRFDEADDRYARIEAGTTDPVELGEPACAQIPSLFVRGRLAEALDLGLGLLARLGAPRPAGDLRAATAAGFDRAERWLDEVSLSADVARPQIAAPAARTEAALLRQLCPPAFFSDHLLLAWLVTESLRLWAEHGPQPDLLPCLGHASSHDVGLRDSTDLDHRIITHALSVGEARGYRVANAHAHFLNALLMGHWYGPLEDVVAETRAAREDLRRAGYIRTAAFACYPAFIGLLDCGSTLDAVSGEVDETIAFGRRTGNDQVVEAVTAYRQLVRTLRGETRGATSFDDDTFDEDAHLEAMMRTNPMAGFYFHFLKAMGAALNDDRDGLRRHLEQVEPLIGIVAGMYGTAVVQLLAGLSAVHRIEAGADVERSSLLATLEGAHRFLEKAARTAPSNFRHLERFLEAERARAAGDVAAALRGYDEALRAADAVTRPWHHALIAERAGTYGLGLGYERLGRALIAEARRHYHSWGAVVKVRALDAAYPWARGHRMTAWSQTSSGASSSLGVTSDSIDMMAILAASQVIGSQTDPDRVRTVLVEQVQSLTGATDVLLVLPDDDGRWFLQPSRVNPEPVEVEAAGERGLLPLGAFRYAERTREPLLVTDAVVDGRFARDRYVATRSRCSLLVVPILGAGALRAVLILTSDLTTEAFTTERLDAVQLIAGQMAVSLDNAQLYRSLEAKVAVRTEALQTAKEQLEQLSVTDALTEVCNRRQFDISLLEEWQRGRTEDWSVAVLMIDIDFFKAYNDSHGHLAGDECIQAVARALTDTVRASDIVCRYGGEEFAIILPKADLRQAFSVALRAHAAVRALEIPHPGEIGRVTVSIGVAARVPDDGLAPQSLVAAADEALYEAKHTGRDQVVSMSPGPLDGRSTTAPGPDTSTS